MGGDSGLPICADQATGGSDRSWASSLLDLSLSKGLSVTAPLEGTDGDGALRDKVLGYLRSAGVSILLTPARKTGCNISAWCNCNYKWIIESL